MIELKILGRIHEAHNPVYNESLLILYYTAQGAFDIEDLKFHINILACLFSYL